jgi:hypothetical protein
MCFNLLVALPLLTIFGLALAFRRLRAGDRASGGTVLFAALMIIYVAMVGNMLEVGENNRFRFPTEFFYWAFFVLALQAGYRRVRRVKA